MTASELLSEFQMHDYTRLKPTLVT